MEREVPSAAAVHAESDASLYSRTDTPSDSEELDLSGLIVILFFASIYIVNKDRKLGILSSSKLNYTVITQISPFYTCNAPPGGGGGTPSRLGV